MQMQATETSRAIAFNSMQGRLPVSFRGRAASIDHRGRGFLVVDDDAFSREQIRSMLAAGQPDRLDTARNVAEALELLLRNPDAYDCVITEIKLPVRSGLELLKAIRLGSGTIPRHLPVLLITGHGNSKLLGMAMALDAQGFLAKPVAFTTLHHRLTRILTDPHAIRPALAYTAVPLASEMLPAAQESLEPMRGFALQSEFAAAPASSQPEIELMLALVPPGSVLARDFRSRQGELLLSAGNTLSRRMLNRLRDLTDLDSVIDSIWVLPQAS